MKKRAVILACCLLAFACAGRFAATRDRPQPTRNPSDAQLAILDRRIESLNFNGATAREAVATVEALGHVNIDPHWSPPAQGGVTPETKLWLRLQDITLGQAMDALVDAMNESVGRPDRLVDYHLRESTIVIAAMQELPRKMLVYDVSDIGSPGNGQPSLTDLVAPLRSYGWWDKATTCSHEPIPGLLAVMHTPRVHAQISSYLRAIRHARSDGSGPAMPVACCWAGNAAGLDMRVYDVRDIAGKFEWSWWAWAGGHNGIDIDPQSQWYDDVEGLRLVLIYTCLELSDGPAAGPQAFAVPGRLVVCETPERHKKVREFLDTLRSGNGEGIRGLRVKGRQ